MAEPGGRDLTRNERARRHLPATAVETHGPEGGNSSRECGLVEGVGNSRLCTSVATVSFLIAEPETGETTSHTTCMTFTV